MLKKILLGLLAVIVVLLVVVALQPADFKVSRTATLKAPPAAVFEQVNDFHKWQVWSPWAKVDPSAKATFSGPDSGEGAKFAWDGNSDVGAGEMTITKSAPPELILINLEFFKPMAGTNLTEFTFTPVADHPDQTTVSWTMSGHKNFISKGMCMVMNMDQMVGGMFEKGLASMETAAQGGAGAGTTTGEPAEIADPTSAAADDEDAAPGP